MHVSRPLAEDPGSASPADLFRQARAGCRDSLNRLMAEHDGLVQVIVRHQVLGSLPFVEALQAGRIGLWQAILRYDSQRGTAFSSYAWPSITRKVWRAAKSHRLHQSAELSVSTLAPPPLCNPDPFAAWETISLRSALYDLLTRLPPRARYILIAYYGLSGDPPASFREIGQDLGLSGEWVRLLHTAALVWLRHPAHSQHLRSLLERHTLADYQAAEEQAQGWLRKRGGRHGC